MKITANESALLTAITTSEYQDGDCVGVEIREDYVLEDCNFGDGAGGVLASASKKGLVILWGGGLISITEAGVAAVSAAA